MMNHLTNRNLLPVDSDAVLDVLTRRQHLHPHKPLRDALQATIDELNCCPVAIERAMQWLQLEWDQPIGRLRRTEIMQLARVIHRMWQQAQNQPQRQSQAQSSAG